MTNHSLYRSRRVEGENDHERLIAQQFLAIRSSVLADAEKREANVIIQDGTSKAIDGKIVQPKAQKDLAL